MIQKKNYKVVVTLMIGLCLMGMAPKQKEEISFLLGNNIETINSSIKNDIKKNSIKLITDNKNEITEIQLLNNSYEIHNITIGDDIKKIENIYPQEWINKEGNHICVAIGNINHFEVVTQYILFIFNNKDKIQEIRIGYTAPFTKYELPKSNEEASNLLKGRWKSSENRLLTFDEAILKDNLLDDLWDNQYYRIIKPNELIINRVKDNRKEKIKIRFWVNENTLNLFLIDEKGLPIQKSIETFIKQD